MPNTADFKKELNAQIGRAKRQGRPHIEVNAGELHRVVGGYPKPEEGHHSMPSCCDAMRSEYLSGRDEIVFEPSLGKGASLTIRYAIPR